MNLQFDQHLRLYGIAKPSKEEETGAVLGRVLSDSSHPIPRVKIYLDDVENGQTNDKGGFLISGIKPGSYEIFTIDANGNGARLPITVAAASLQEIPEIQLKGLQRLSGRLLLKGEDSSAGTFVKAIKAPFSASTNEEGRFYLDLPAGTYSFQLTPRLLRFATVLESDLEVSGNTHYDRVIEPNPYPTGSLALINGEVHNIIRSMTTRIRVSAVPGVKYMRINYIANPRLKDFKLSSEWNAVTHELVFEHERPGASTLAVQFQDDQGKMSDQIYLDFINLDYDRSWRIFAGSITTPIKIKKGEKALFLDMQDPTLAENNAKSINVGIVPLPHPVSNPAVGDDNADITPESHPSINPAVDDVEVNSDPLLHPSNNPAIDDDKVDNPRADHLIVDSPNVDVPGTIQPQKQPENLPTPEPQNSQKPADLPPEPQSSEGSEVPAWDEAYGYGETDQNSEYSYGNLPIFEKNVLIEVGVLIHGSAKFRASLQVRGNALEPVTWQPSSIADDYANIVSEQGTSTLEFLRCKQCKIEFGENSAFNINQSLFIQSAITYFPLASQNTALTLTHSTLADSNLNIDCPDHDGIFTTLTIRNTVFNRTHFQIPCLPWGDAPTSIGLKMSNNNFLELPSTSPIHQSMYYIYPYYAFNPSSNLTQRSTRSSSSSSNSTEFTDNFFREADFICPIEDALPKEFYDGLRDTPNLDAGAVILSE